ncbi:hypothetical protein P167DRAFT_533602 [Morchella conica CCBAS932]|uniref:Uncharacterized protein n=1 Tax=Morchella conica CCBAS932 TaxID=1392247 RepID=A0A3N4KWX8_9PEZI|nr:hypothetical protein P167DRAFT_533602 [Morchella conica CCBAS932]
MLIHVINAPAAFISRLAGGCYRAFKTPDYVVCGTAPIIGIFIVMDNTKEHCSAPESKNPPSNFSTWILWVILPVIRIYGLVFFRLMAVAV